MNFPKLTLVLGGAASGKSRFAEDLALQSDLRRSYVATAQAFDDEMRDKISKHQHDRGRNWLTTEAPVDLADAVCSQPAGSVILIDCLTMWLSNLMLKERSVTNTGEILSHACDRFNGPIICVSNEVGQGIVPESALGRKFREAQGKLNQEMAAKSDLVVLIVSGLPLVIKGQLPKDVT